MNHTRLYTGHIFGLIPHSLHRINTRKTYRHASERVNVESNWTEGERAVFNCVCVCETEKTSDGGNERGEPRKMVVWGLGRGRV